MQGQISLLLGLNLSKEQGSRKFTWKQGLVKKDVSRGSLLTWLEKNQRGEALAPTPTLQGMFDEGVFTAQKAPQSIQITPTRDETWLPKGFRKVATSRSIDSLGPPRPQSEYETKTESSLIL